LPGYVLTQLFSGIFADYAIFLTIYTLSTVFLFKAAELLCSRCEALFVTIFFSLSPFVVANYGWTLFAPTIMYEIITLFCVARAIVTSDFRKRIGWVFLSGLAWGAAINSHLAMLIFCVFIYFLFALCVVLEFELPLRSRIRLLALSAACVI